MVFGEPGSPLQEAPFPAHLTYFSSPILLFDLEQEGEGFSCLQQVASLGQHALTAEWEVADRAKAHVLTALSLNSPVRVVRHCRRGTLRMGRSQSTLPPSLPEIPGLHREREHLELVLRLSSCRATRVKFGFHWKLHFRGLQTVLSDSHQGEVQPRRQAGSQTTSVLL